MFVIECRMCGFYFDADVPDRNICMPCLREAEQAQMIEELNRINQEEKQQTLERRVTSHEERSKTTE